jgi:hypothetical protein
MEYNTLVAHSGLSLQEKIDFVGFGSLKSTDNSNIYYRNIFFSETGKTESSIFLQAMSPICFF